MHWSQYVRRIYQGFTHLLCSIYAKPFTHGTHDLCIFTALLRSIYAYLLHAWYARFTCNLRNVYVIFTQHLRSIYAVFTRNYLCIKRSIYAAFTRCFRICYAVFTQNPLRMVTVFTPLLRSIYAYLLYAWYTIFTRHLRNVYAAFTQYLTDYLFYWWFQ